jgi:DNA-binding NarL/FixJ family response regulator
MNGYELARNIRRSEFGTSGTCIPIVAYTANALGGEAEVCLAAGMDDYLVKPDELSQLLENLDQWLPIPDDGVKAASTFGRPPDARTVAPQLIGRCSPKPRGATRQPSAPS